MDSRFLDGLFANLNLGEQLIFPQQQDVVKV